MVLMDITLGRDPELTNGWVEEVPSRNYRSLLSITGGAIALDLLTNNAFSTFKRISPFALPLLSSLLVYKQTKAVK